MISADKPLVWLEGEIKTPPFSKEARVEAGTLLRRLQEGEALGMPHSRPMPTIGRRCHELRVRDEDQNWRIIYRLDANGRYESGQVFAADGALRFKTRYKYNPAGQLAEETQIARDDSVLHRIVYSFDAQGHQNGYAIYDGAGRLLGRVNPKTTTQKSAKDRKH